MFGRQISRLFTLAAAALLLLLGTSGPFCEQAMAQTESTVQSQMASCDQPMHAPDKSSPKDNACRTPCVLVGVKAPTASTPPMILAPVDPIPVLPMIGLRQAPDLEPPRAA